MTKKMYLGLNERNDFIYIEGNDSKFYPHPTIEKVYCSVDGQVARTRTLFKGKTYLLNQRIGKNGYSRVAWASSVKDENGRSMHNYLTHRLIAETFIPLPNDKDKFEVDHINCNRSDNHVSNLRWLTKKENLKKRDLSLLKSTFVFDKDTDTVTEYKSRIEAAKATELQTSNITNAIKYEQVVRNRYFITDIELTSEEYYYAFKEYDLKVNRRKKVKLYKDDEEHIFDSAVEASRFLGCNKNGVGRVCSGRGKTVFGWRAEWIRGV